MAFTQKQAANKKNQRQRKKVLQVQLGEINDNENMADSDVLEMEDDHEFESDKAEHKERDLVLEEDEYNDDDDNDEVFLKKKLSEYQKMLSKLQKKAKQIKVEKEEKRKLDKTNKTKKAKKEEDIQNNGNKFLTKVTKVGGESNEKTKESKGKQNARTLYIGNLPDGVSEQDLKNLSKDIVEIQIPKRMDGPNFRFALIRFKDEATAKTSYKILQTKKIKDEPLVIDYVGRKSSHDNLKIEKQDARSLYIGKLPVGVTEQDLKSLSKDIVKIGIPKRKDGTNIRFAFIRFKDEATAETNYNILKTRKIKDEPLAIDYVGRKSSHDNLKTERNARKIFVGNLPNDIKEKELKKLSEDIVEIYISQSKKKFAFLIFDSQDKAEFNYEILKDPKIRGQPIFLDMNGSKRTCAKESIAKKGKRSHKGNLQDEQRSAKKMRR